LAGSALPGRGEADTVALMSGTVSSRAGLLSEQVSGGRYFFLKLTPPRGARLVPVLGGCEACNADYVVRRRRFAYHGLEYVAEGAGFVTLDQREAPLAPGTVFSYAPETDCEIRTDSERPMLKYFVCLAGTGVAARLAGAGVAPGRVRALAPHAEVRTAIEELIRAGRHPGRVAARLCEALIEVLLLKIEDLATRPARSSPGAEESFARCKALIDARTEGLATLEEIAAAMRIAPSSICRLFRRFQGTSPYQYLLRRKMTIAAEFLIETGGHVREAAQRVGFADPYHFSRCFKAIHGVSPNQLRGYRRRSPDIS
jgi:AraC family transcriptional regulator